MQVYYQLTAPTLELQIHSYMFQLPSIATLSKQHYSKPYTALDGLLYEKIYKIHINSNILLSNNAQYELKTMLILLQ
jgi:hypothetical protein